MELLALSNAAQESSKLRAENCPVDLATRGS